MAWMDCTLVIGNQPDIVMVEKQQRSYRLKAKNYRDIRMEKSKKLNDWQSVVSKSEGLSTRTKKLIIL